MVQVNVTLSYLQFNVEFLYSRASDLTAQLLQTGVNGLRAYSSLQRSLAVMYRFVEDEILLQTGQ